MGETVLISEDDLLGNANITDDLSDISAPISENPSNFEYFNLLVSQFMKSENSIDYSVLDVQYDNQKEKDFP